MVRWDREATRQRVPQNLRVCDLLCNQGRDWNLTALAKIFPEEEEWRQIVRIRTCGSRRRDVYIWDYNKTCYYIVKSGYWVQTNVIGKQQSPMEGQSSMDPLFQLAWDSDTSTKIHHFLWRYISNTIPVAGNMARRHIFKEAGCLRCGYDAKSVNHVLFQCPFARLVWALSPIPAPPDGLLMNSLYSNVYHVLNIWK